MGLRLKVFDVSFRTAYAQAKELAVAQATVPLLTAGTVQTEKRSNAEFVYRYRYDLRGKRVVEYLGPAGDAETQSKAELARADIRDANIVGGYSRDLRRLGFYSADNSTCVTVAALFNAGIFRGRKGGILVGTHAFGAICNELGISVAPFPQTDDVDTGRAETIQLATPLPGGFLSLLKTTGLAFNEVPQLRRKEAATSFKARGQNLKVDLLVPAKAKPYISVPVPELAAHATALPHFRFLLTDPIPSMLLGRDRLLPITVPHAGRFCIHKLAVYSLRSGGDDSKRDKDVFQASVLAAALAANQDFLLHEAIDAMDKELRNKAARGAQRAIELLGDEHPEAVRILLFAR